MRWARGASHLPAQLQYAGVYGAIEMERGRVGQKIQKSQRLRICVFVHIQSRAFRDVRRKTLFNVSGPANLCVGLGRGRPAGFNVFWRLESGDCRDRREGGFCREFKLTWFGSPSFRAASMEEEDIG